LLSFTASASKVVVETVAVFCNVRGEGGATIHVGRTIAVTV
jgi:hypothetical protein